MHYKILWGDMSDEFYIEGGKSTPKVSFSPQERILVIEGESYPEDATLFYEPVIRRIRQFLDKSDKGIELQIQLLYVNTSSSKALLVMFDMLEEAHQEGKICRILWLYDEENETSCEVGEDLSDGLKIPFSIEKTL